MNDWELLGIAATTDRTELKRAYNRKLREHPPEKDPVGFMRLRAAYERLQEAFDRSERVSGAYDDRFEARDGEDADGDDESSSEGDNFRHDSTLPPEWNIQDSPVSEPESTGPRGKPWSRLPPWENGSIPGRDRSGGRNFTDRPFADPSSPPEGGDRRRPFTGRPDGSGGPPGSLPPVPPANRWFSPGSAKDVTFPGDQEVNPLWLAFRELWSSRRDDPEHEAWKDLIDLLEMDRTLRVLFSRRLARFFEECFATKKWHDASRVLLWRLAVVLRWDRESSETEEIVGCSIASALDAWRLAAAVDSLSRRFRMLAKELGWNPCEPWDDFFALVESDSRLRQAFEPVGRELMRQQVRMDFSSSNPGWIEIKFDEMAKLNASSPKEQQPVIPPRPPAHVGPVPLENLQTQDRAMLWGLALIGLAILAFLAYQIGKRILGG
ncbi:MAG: J domain-containing protein [Fibrobacteres bacterium]|nr:J domain-containing protein [Fibrobacterota bacterium]